MVKEQGSFGVESGAAAPRFQLENVGRPAFYDMPADLSDEDREAHIRNTGLTRNDAMWDYSKSNFEEQNVQERTQEPVHGAERSRDFDGF